MIYRIDNFEVGITPTSWDIKDILDSGHKVSLGLNPNDQDIISVLKEAMILCNSQKSSRLSIVHENRGFIIEHDNIPVCRLVLL